MESGRIALIIILLTGMLLPHPATSGAATVMELYGTFHAMGVIVTLTEGEDTDQDAVALISCRVAGSGDYRHGLPLSRVSAGRFVGSLFSLSPGTSYDVRVSFSDPDGAPLNGVTVNGSAATRPEIALPAPSKSYHVTPTGGGSSCSAASPCSLTTALDQAQGGQEIVLHGGAYYQGGISLPRSGTAGAPIVIRGYQGETPVIDGADPATFTWTAQGGGVYRTTVNVGNSHLVLADGQRLYPYQNLADLQGLAWGIPGFYAEGTTLHVRLAGDADPNTRSMRVSRFNSAFTIEQSFIVLADMTFRHYGLGDYGKALYFNNASDNLVKGCTFAVNDLGIGLKRDSHRNVFQDNSFYDTDFAWPWDAVKEGSALETGGIRMYDPMTGRGTVIRRNTFHDYFDGFGVCPGVTAALSNETDVYENLVYNAGDDGMETDGQCSNVRIWDNTFHDVLVGISLAPVYTGPVYAVRNLVYRTGAGNSDYPGSPFKFNSGYDPSGQIYLFHNTADAVLPGSSGLDIKSPGRWKEVYGRNNIWSGTDYAISNANPGQPLDLDHDDLYTTRAGELAWWEDLSDRHLNSLTELQAATGQELHGLNAAPGFYDAAAGNYTLGSASPLIDQGVIIPGINDGYSGAAPDIGAYESIPAGPINGTCGDADGGIFNSSPGTGLCSSGTNSPVTGTGPWNWICLGANGGANEECCADITHFTLTVNKTGNGSGAVSPDRGVLVWNGQTGTGSWPYNTQIDLTGSPDGLSTFGGWSGACVPSGLDCTATMSSDRTVNAAFIAAPTAKIGANGYATLNEAYAAAAATGTTTILTLDTVLNEGLYMDKGKDIAISGGWNAAYNTRTGVATILAGDLAINSGSLTIDGLAIK